VTDARLSRRAKWATAALALVILIDLIAVVFDLVEWRLLDRLESGGDVTDAELAASDDRQGAIGVLQVGVYILTAVAFIVWFHRAYRRTEELGAETRYGGGWAIGAWFVPILSLWRPKQIANDMWRGSDPDAPPGPETAWRDQPVSPLLAVWWGAFLITNWGGIAVYNMRDEAGTVAAFKEASLVTLGADAFDVLAAVLAILVVRKLTERLQKREAVVASEPEPALEL
jgi:hypothetical protein